MHDLSLEQPIFGANYIKGKAFEPGNASKLTFKLKFNSGGATEYGQALLNAARAMRNFSSQMPNGFQPNPNVNPASQYYQAPPNVYQPAYNCGFALPNDIFNQPPPAGFIYTSEAPPPYPGLNTKDNAPGFNKSGPPPGYPSQPNQSPGFPLNPPQNYPGPNPNMAAGPPAYPGSQPPFQQPNGYNSAGWQTDLNFRQPASNPHAGPRTVDERPQQSMYPNLNDLPSAPPPP
ncbi:hypothetical protein SSS_09902 [Sarcoptes scabiei]|nr:hypothetical protein SSS_09902 [Sarcoptes scabiei]